ncbi:MAG: hypothetical protein IT442_01395 [Phycisphaeraceae bacterium]|nr:hypothetical protein [Phycisphaeraceae bacterium]
MARKVPSYRVREGYNQAIVTLTDADTGRQRDYWLGPADSPESQQRYHHSWPSGRPATAACPTRLWITPTRPQA